MTERANTAYPETRDVCTVTLWVTPSYLLLYHPFC